MTRTYLDAESRLARYTDYPPTCEQLQLACLQRIASATEAMAKSHVQLVADWEWMKRRKEAAEATTKGLHRSNAALRGVISRMKREAGK